MPGLLALADPEPERVRRVKRLLIWAASLLLLAGCAGGAEPVRILFIDVGKGDAALIMDSGRNYLIDAGPRDAWGAVQAALSHYGVEKLDAVFLTHGDKDHSGGLKPLSDSGIEIVAWYAADLYSLDEDVEVHPIAAAAEARGQRPAYLSAGDAVGPFTVLAPLERDKKDDDNNSLVLLLECAGGRALLTGDMKFGEEEDLLKSGRSLTCDVLKIAHHGNSDATSDLLIDRAKPRLAVVSTDSDERPELPDARVAGLLASRGIPLYSTWRSGGGVLVTLDGGARAENVAIPAPSE